MLTRLECFLFGLDLGLIAGLLGGIWLYAWFVKRFAAKGGGTK